MKKLSINSIALFFASLMMFISCEQYDDSSLNNDEILKSSNVEQTEQSYQKMMNQLRTDIDDVLMTSIPEEMSLIDYKSSLLLGELELSEQDVDAIEVAYLPLDLYGKNLAINNEIDIDTNNKAETLALGGMFSPEDSLDFNASSENNLVVYHNPGLTWGEVGYCVIAGLGADALYSLAFSGGVSWGAAALTTVFSKAAARFMGPIGVAIAVVSFGLCLASEAQD